MINFLEYLIKLFKQKFKSKKFKISKLNHFVPLNEELSLDNSNNIILIRGIREKNLEFR